MKAANIILLPGPANQETNYTWNPLWVKEYESPWGVFEKFKYANNITSKEFLRTFGTDELRSVKHLSLFYVNANVHTMGRLSEDIILKILKVPVKAHTSEILDFVQKRVLIEELLRSDLAYCRYCMRSGYHSIFHQLKFIHSCPFHPHAKLYNSCPTCKKSFKYMINDPFSAFRCQCGTELFNKPDYHIVWRNHKPNIVFQPLQKLLQLSENDITTLKEMEFVHYNDVEEHPRFLEAYLSRLDPTLLKTEKIEHKVIVSNENLLQQGNRQEEYRKAYYDGDLWTTEGIDNKIANEIYKSTVATYNALCNRIRKTILKKCLKELLRENYKIICPYAYAYLNWRVCIEGLRYHSDIATNYYRKRRSTENTGIDTISNIDVSVFTNLRLAWDGSLKYNDGNRRYKSLTATIWLINHFLYRLLMNHFYNWLEFADKKRYKKKDTFIFTLEINSNMKVCRYSHFHKKVIK
ncbi:hypothetical protein GZH47_31315 [Paenibacillus rhizovicinus]|uniref:TniQ family protein n=1 Tax=Paenibacillus rhizovicinus TaxID=2704463 RepID=A0A6C0P882_9BACL|nr:hypothetical protein [Paenibacillus rhizovicinus]QHW34840.1 hypothetical protein GZH47_31315 [Paenibacillus rhizovicinus]